MKSKLKRVGPALVALAAAVSIVPLVAPPTASAAGVLSGPAEIRNPGGSGAMTSGANTSPFTLRLPAGAACAGDTANDFYFLQSYIVPASVDPSSLQFDAAGPTPQDVGANFSQPLLDTNGSPYVNQATLANPGSPRPRPGEVINIPNFILEFFPVGSMLDGAYNMGIACTVGPPSTTQMKEFWNTTFTVSGGGTAWTVGAVPAAPVISSVTAGNNSLDVAFTHAPSTPATTQYTVTATPTGGGTPVTATGTASPITIGGLVNGTQYDVTVHATNDAGNSPESSVMTASPAQPDWPAVGSLSAVPGAPGSGTADVTWTAPSAGPTPTGYNVVVDPAAGVTVDHTGTATSAALSGLTENTAYTVTVTATYADPQDVGTPASTDLAVLPAAVVYQQLDVTVPEGVLTITQVCGQGPTGCAVDFGTASLITTGTGAGQFYEAEADLLQLTVTDTRDEDPGWTATGTMGTFSAGAGADFSGDQLGWTPVAVGSGGYSSPSGAYTQNVSAGPPVAPNTVDGLGNGATLATATDAQGLGIFTLDAQVELLIPVYAISGNYSGVLTITAS